MYDLDAVSTPDEGIPFDFKFGGEKFQLPGTVDVFAASAMANGDLNGGLERLLGPQQWRRMQAVDAVMDNARLTALLDEYRRHLGVGVGESGASTRS